MAHASVRSVCHFSFLWLVECHLSTTCIYQTTVHVLRLYFIPVTTATSIQVVKTPVIKYKVLSLICTSNIHCWLNLYIADAHNSLKQTQALYWLIFDLLDNKVVLNLLYSSMVILSSRVFSIVCRISGTGHYLYQLVVRYYKWYIIFIFC